MSRLRTLMLTTAAAIAASTSAHAGAPAAPAPADNPIVNLLDGAEPGKVTVAGITVYGAFDVGGYYSSHTAANQSAPYYNGNEYLVSKNSLGSKTSFVNNALNVSFIGLKGAQDLGALTGLDSLRSWSVGFNLQSAFDPLYGTLANNCGSLVLNNGKAIAQQSMAGDGSRCGQVFNGEAYASLKNDLLGELRFGRQNTLLQTTLNAYDATTGSPAFSMFTWTGTYGGGAGNTEDGRWNNVLQYTNTIGLVRVGAAYRFEGGGEGGRFWALQGGIDMPGALKGLSFDGVYSKEETAITAGSLSTGQCTSLLSAAGAGQCPSTRVLTGTVTDNEAWAIMAKYKFTDGTLLKGATVMGGYQHISLQNASGTLDSNNTLGGYSLLNIGGVNNVNYTPYKSGDERTLDVIWVGGKYMFTPKLSVAASWYHVEQNTFTASNAVGTPATCNGKTGVAASPNCAGNLNWYSAVLDYQVTKRLDYYAGITYTDVADGLASGFANTNNFSVASGVRFRF